MQSNQPIPGNPWPQEMIIAVEENPDRLTFLLFLRAAWGIAADAVLPELERPPAPGRSAPPPTASVDEWSVRWKFEWLAAWSRLSMPDRTIPWTEEEIDRLDPLDVHAPGWRETYGMDGVDEAAWHVWSASLERHPHARPLAEQPERVSLDSLVPAWRTGLKRILVLPFAGYFAERVAAECLVVSAETRNDAAMYSRALSLRL